MIVEKIVKSFNLTEYDKISEELRLQLQNLCFDFRGDVEKTKVEQTKILACKLLSKLNEYIYELNEVLQHFEERESKNDL